MVPFFATRRSYAKVDTKGDCSLDIIHEQGPSAYCRMFYWGRPCGNRALSLVVDSKLLASTFGINLRKVLRANLTLNPRDCGTER